MGKLKHVFIGQNERCEICNGLRKAHPEKGVILERIPTATEAVHKRTAYVLGWPLKEVQSFSLGMLREIVRLDHPSIADEISRILRINEHITRR